MLRAHFLYEPDEETMAYLRETLPSDVQLSAGDAEFDAGSVEILIGGRPRSEHVVSSPMLRMFVIPFAGVPVSLRAILKGHPAISVHNLHHNAQATAETAIALCLAAAKNIVPIDQKLRANDWSPRYEGGGELLLAGRTAVILGYGAIGREIATVCRALGMAVDGVRRRDSRSLAVLLPGADVLFVAVPLTDETEGMLGTAELALLPDDSIVVNVARGPVLDESAFFAELASGRIRAGVDVWYSYPKGPEDAGNTPPSKHPFHELENVVLSPHRGAHCDAVERLRRESLGQLLLAAHRGEDVPNRVDLELGY